MNERFRKRVASIIGKEEDQEIDGACSLETEVEVEAQDNSDAPRDITDQVILALEIVILGPIYLLWFLVGGYGIYILFFAYR